MVLIAADPLFSTTEFPVPASAMAGSLAAEDGTEKPASRWKPSVDRLPPIVQFLLHVIQWMKGKCLPRENQPAALRIVGQLALGGKRHLTLVEAGGRQFLVGGGSENVTVIVPIVPYDGPDAGSEPLS